MIYKYIVGDDFVRKKPKWIIQVNYISDTDEERRINCTSIVQKMINRDDM